MLLLPVDPHDKNCLVNNPCIPQISEITLNNRGHIKNSVDLIWHTESEYSHLSKDQFKGLYEWHHTKNGKDHIEK